MNFTNIVNHIYNVIFQQKEILKSRYEQSSKTIGYFYVDNLLPEEIALACAKAFPSATEMRKLKSLKEFKHISAQMNKHDKILETVLYAFQDDKIVNLIQEICNIKNLEPDSSLYAGGLSSMQKGNFLNPHLDNSHDADRKRWRVLNLLYYVTPNWTLQNGGHLELWPNSPSKSPLLLESKFNRLIIMATHNNSWHSVNKVTVDRSRNCISNYYFSNEPLQQEDEFHVTTFTGRPNEPIKKILLEVDAKLRMLVRKVFKKGIRKNPHVYKKED